MKLKCTAHKEIEKNDQITKIQNSHGYDGIPMKIRKVSTTPITSPLTNICNKSLPSGIPRPPPPN